MSVTVVVCRNREFEARRTIRPMIPTRHRTAAASAVDSRMKRRTGTLFQITTWRGNMKPIRWPRKSVRMPRLENVNGSWR